MGVIFDVIVITLLTPFAVEFNRRQNRIIKQVLGKEESEQHKLHVVYCSGLYAEAMEKWDDEQWKKLGLSYRL